MSYPKVILLVLPFYFLNCSAESDSDIVKYAASLLKIKNIKKINFDDPQLNEKTKSFYLDNKKVSNRKIKKILGWTPKYRNYKLGLKSIFKLIS